MSPNNERGRGQNDVRQRFVFSAVWDLSYGKSLSNAVARALLRDWTVASISQLQTGQPFSVTVSGDAGNDGNANNDRAPNRTAVFTPTTNFLQRLTMQPLGVGSRVFQIAGRVSF